MKGPNYFKPDLNKFLHDEKNYYWILFRNSSWNSDLFVDKYIFNYGHYKKVDLFR